MTLFVKKGLGTVTQPNEEWKHQHK